MIVGISGDQAGETGQSTWSTMIEVGLYIDSYFEHAWNNKLVGPVPDMIVLALTVVQLQIF